MSSSYKSAIFCVCCARVVMKAPNYLPTLCHTLHIIIPNRTVYKMINLLER